MYKLNPLSGPIIKRNRYCSVCGRRGHLADDCRLSSAFLDFKIAPMTIVKYRTIYPDSRRNDLEPKPQPEKKRITRFSDVVPTNASPAIVPAVENNRPKTPVIESRPAPEIVAATNPKPVVEKIPYKITFDVQSDERQVTSTTRSVEQLPQPPTTIADGQPIVARKMSPNSDSNYSFSEFFDKDNPQMHKRFEVASSEVLSEQSADDFTRDVILQPAEDFISINNSEVSSLEATTTVAEKPTSSVSSSNNNQEDGQAESEAKIYLSKDHCKILINERGNRFLRDQSEAFKLRVRLEWQSVGNLLTVFGRAVDQDAFHKKLINFLTESNEERITVPVNRLPGRSDRLLKLLDEKLKMLKTDLGNPNLYFYDYRKYRQDVGPKAKKKVRLAIQRMNMIFYGQMGYFSGTKWCDQLRGYTRTLRESSGEQMVDADTRSRIEETFDYVFGDNDHKNYDVMLKWYRKHRAQNRSKAAKQPSPKRAVSPV